MYNHPHSATSSPGPPPIAPRMPSSKQNNSSSRIAPASAPEDNRASFVPIASAGPALRPNSAKRAHKRTYQSMMSGPKMPPLKKKDGEALWRRDIQYDFLNAVFTDHTKAFTPSHPSKNKQEHKGKNKDKTAKPAPHDSSSEGNSGKVTFADVYLEAMAHSTKCSKILGEKLLGDRQAGIKIAMVCLLVNWGRMNTTLNFFPEMKTVLRTYHPIPSLQTHDTQDYKQLQDAPRLKSILKGACEATNEPNTLKALEESSRLPRTNPINLVFLMSTFSHDVEREMFPPQCQFSYFDLIMDTSKTSESRARAFLWLVWAYLEAPNLRDNSMNPYGAHFPVPKPFNKTSGIKENTDTAAELVFGNQMTLQRLAILDAPGSSQSGADNEDGDIESAEGSANGKILEKPEAGDGTEKASSEIKSNAEKTLDKTVDIPLVTPKPRLRSAKDRRIREEFNSLLRHKRSQYKARRLARNNAMRDTWKRINDLDPLYNSDDDCSQAKINGKSHGLGPGVIATGLSTKYSDYGEHSLSIAIALRRAAKRLNDSEKLTTAD